MATATVAFQGASLFQAGHRRVSVAVQLKQILASSINNNVRFAVTGGLVFNRNYFLQVLEGGRSNVTKVFSTISADLRHDQIELVEVKDVRERLFAAWSMGFASTPELIKELWTKMDIQGEFNPKLLTGDQIVKLIFELVKKEEGFCIVAKVLYRLICVSLAADASISLVPIPRQP